MTDIGITHEIENTQPDGPVAPQQGDQYLSYADWDALTCLACGWEPPSQAHIDEHGWPQSRSDLLIEHEGRAHKFFLVDNDNENEANEAKAKASAALTALGREPRPIVRRYPRLRSDRLPVYVSFADWDRLRCVLCRRAFREKRLIWLHEQQSALHRRMLADAGNRERAKAELKGLGLGVGGVRVLEAEAEFCARWEALRRRVVGGGAGQPQYRDRARERRRAFGVAKNAAAGGGGGSGSAAATVPEKRKEQQCPAEEGEEQPAAKKSRGAGLLAKMGWTAGAGLGAEGAGRTEAIATEVYAPGVGLGAEGGKLGDASEEAARNTRGNFAGFVEKTRERARERFERM
jgi:hypothetical protein